MTKIFAAGDIHGDTLLAEKLSLKAEDADLIVLCGDLTHFEESTEGIVGPFKKLQKPILLLNGNHETSATGEFLAKFYKETNIHGYSLKHNQIGFFGCSGVNIGIHQLSEDEIFQYLEKAHSYVKESKIKVMITHVHPSETLMDKLSDFVPGSSGILKAIKEFKPDLLICSHVHEAEGIEEIIHNTKVINVGSKGKLIDLNN